MTLATVVMTAGPAHAATKPAALTGGPCGASFMDAGPVTILVHSLVEPLLVPSLSNALHGLNCTLASEGL